MREKQPPIFIQSIKQKDNHTFSIQWSDGVQNDYQLASLQKRCPCASCYYVITGKQLVPNQQINKDVRAINIISIGRYAIKIQFTIGCSNGIYSYAMLREIASRPQEV
jgi:ATP-binding protein involved in chromosome partitioning